VVGYAPGSLHRTDDQLARISMCPTRDVFRK
jgi:hypothetical protein